MLVCNVPVIPFFAANNEEGLQRPPLLADNSGTVSFKELATALSVISKGKPEEKLAYLFDVYDINGDATLDKDELNKIVEQMKTVAKELGRDEASINDFIAGLMKKIDKNGDGQVSKSEWIDGGLRSPSLLVLLGANQL
jgi:diacylglycerol kinase (ATP)